MTWPCKPPLWTAVLALLAGCACMPPPAPPPLPAADVRRAEQHAYWLGYAAGRHYQKQQDAQNTPDAPSPAPVSVPDAAMPPVTATSAAPPRPVPPPVDGYFPKGPAQPVATPAN